MRTETVPCCYATAGPLPEALWAVLAHTKRGGPHGVRASSGQRTPVGTAHPPPHLSLPLRTLLQVVALGHMLYNNLYASKLPMYIKNASFCKVRLHKHVYFFLAWLPQCEMFVLAD